MPFPELNAEFVDYLDGLERDEEDNTPMESFFSSSFSPWLLPYLALVAQLPFEAEGVSSNLMVLFLAVGSPVLIIYSLALTVLQTRWINHKFQKVKKMNARVGGRHFGAIEAARRCLIESQHFPVQVYQGPERVLAQLIVNPLNRRWWINLDRELQKTRRPWTYSLVAQLFWAFFAQTFAIIGFITTADFRSMVGLGLAINNVWIWMIPVVFGWVCIGTQTSAHAFEAALMAIDPPSVDQKSTTTNSCTGFNVSSRKYCDEEQRFELSLTSSRTSRVNQMAPKHGSPDNQSDRVTQSLRSPRETSLQMKQTFLGLSTRGCERETGPIFNFARFWNFTANAAYVLEGFSELNSEQACKPPKTVSGRAWNYKTWESNFQGSSEMLSRYIFSHTNFDRDFLSLHSARSPVSRPKFSLVATLLLHFCNGQRLAVPFSWHTCKFTQFPDSDDLLLATIRT